MNPEVTWMELLYLALLALLAAALLPPVKLRRAALALLQRGVQLIGLAAVIACAAFVIWPAAAPEALASALQPLEEALATFAGDQARSLVWLVAAAGVCLVAAPLAIALGFARRLDTLGTLLRRVAGVLRPAGGTARGTVPVSRGAWCAHDELDEAVRSMGTTASELPKQTKRRKLADLLDQ